MVRSGDGRRNILLGCPKQFTVDSLFSYSQNNVSKIIKNARGDMYILGSLSNHDDDGNKNPTNLHI